MSHPNLCPHCGHGNPVVARFCAHCGTNLQKRDTSRLPSAKAADETAEKPNETLADQPTAAEPTMPDRSSESVETDTSTGRRANATQTGEDIGERNPALKPEEHRSSPALSPPAADEDNAVQSPRQAASPSPPAVQLERLLTDIQGAIEPTDPLEFVASSGDASDLAQGLEVSEEDRRQLRELLSSELPLAANAVLGRASGESETASAGRGLRRRWFEWFLLLGLAIALLLGASSSEAKPHLWPGVLQAHRQIEALPLNSLVLVNWAYDPATAGEMDLVAQPVIEHLLRKQAQLIVVSQLPGGPATARRLIAKAGESVQWPARPQVTTIDIVEGGFFPGGAASLPLLGVAPAESLPIDPGWVNPKGHSIVSGLADAGPDLNLLIAARAEDVRRWLEQVQPLNNGAVIAVTSAVVDPALRPYWHSGQLAGLVSGWDGGSAYQSQSVRPQSIPEQARSWRQISGQNWGFALLLVVIVLGNLTGLAAPNGG